MKIKAEPAALILLSGGLDSALSLALVRQNYSKMLALTFDYLQRPAAEEIQASKQLADFYKIKHKVIKLDWLGLVSNSALNKEEEIRQEDALDNEKKESEAAKSVYVPNRNALFINIAASIAEALSYQDIIIGANKEEAQTFKDNTKSFINSANNLLKYSVNAQITVKAPLIDMTKKDIAAKSIELDIPFNLIYSCYNSGGRCGRCASCLRMKRAFEENGRYDIVNSIFKV